MMRQWWPQWGWWWLGWLGLWPGLGLAAELKDAHLLDQIQLINLSGRPALVIQGTISPALVPLATVTAGPDAQVVTVTLPQSFANHLKLQRRVPFAQSDLLEEIQVQEDPAQALVMLQVQARTPIVLNLDPQSSNSEQIVFWISGDAVAQYAMGMVSKGLPSSTRAMTSAADPMLLHPVAAMMMFQRPTQLQISILNTTPNREAAQSLAILMDRQQRKDLEARLGMRMEITNISSVQEKVALPKTKIYFRPNFLAAALALAEIIPGEQIVEQMPQATLEKLGVDIEIYLGANFE